MGICKCQEIRQPALRLKNTDSRSQFYNEVVCLFVLMRPLGRIKRVWCFFPPSMQMYLSDLLYSLIFHWASYNRSPQSALYFWACNIFTSVIPEIIFLITDFLAQPEHLSSWPVKLLFPIYSVCPVTKRTGSVTFPTNSLIDGSTSCLGTLRS